MTTMAVKIDYQSRGGKTTVASVDVTKIILAVFIVFLHSGVSSVLPNGIGFYVEKALLRLAVPTFFVISGNMLERKLEISIDEERNVFCSYCLRLLYPLVFWEAVNIVFEIVNSYLIGETWGHIFLKIVRSVVAYPYGALWYVQASIVGALLIYPLIKRKRLDLCLIIFGLLYLWALLCNSYYFCVEETILQNIIYWYIRIFVSARNGLFMGAFFLSLGIFTRRVEKKIKGNKWIFLVGLLLSYLVYLIEITSLRNKNMADDGSLFLSYIILIPLLVMNICWHNVNIPEKVSFKLRHYSTGIYFLHRPLLASLQLFQNLSGNIIGKEWQFLITICVAVMICTIVYRKEKGILYSLLM